MQTGMRLRPKPNLTRDIACLLGLTLLAVTVAPSSVNAAAKKWRFVTSGEGVRVYDLPEAGRAVPRFRGIAVINAPAMQLLAVLADVGRACEWNTACKHSIVLKKTGDLQMVFHNRLKAPWPVSDRDAILKTSAKISEDGRRISALFRAIRYPSRPPKKGVVRFPRLIGKYVMTALGPNKTRVVYTIDSDSGGWLPGWVVRYATKKVPIGTLAGLRKQAKRTAGQYKRFITKHAPKVSASTAPATRQPGS